MRQPKTLVLCDNDWIRGEIKKVFLKKGFDVEIFKSDSYDEPRILKEKFDLIISAHCKKIFSKELVESTRIINIHPGLNPYNRGMYPHIFSIINGLPTGATIHEIDEFIDNGDIIAQKEIEVFVYDDSKTLHERIMRAEIDLFEKHFEEIIHETYAKTKPPFKGNINYKKDFDRLCEIDLKSENTFENYLNLLRALSYGDHKNAFFYDKNGNKVFLKLEISFEKKDL